MTDETRPLPVCPVCEYWDGGHAPGCVMSRLRALGSEGRQAHRRALLLVTLMTAGTAMTLSDLADTTGIPLHKVGSTVHPLFAEGLAYVGLHNLPVTVALTTAPHVEQACLAAAELLGLMLTQPRLPLSPLLDSRSVVTACRELI